MPRASVSSTTAPAAGAPLQSSGSWPVGYTVPAKVNTGASPSSPDAVFSSTWQEMQARPGAVAGDGRLPTPLMPATAAVLPAGDSATDQKKSDGPPRS